MCSKLYQLLFARACTFAIPFAISLKECARTGSILAQSWCVLACVCCRVDIDVIVLVSRGSLIQCSSFVF